MINKNAETMYTLDQNIKKVLELLKDTALNTTQLQPLMNMKRSSCTHLVRRMKDSGLVIAESYRCNVAKRTLIKYKASGKEFIPRSYDECLQIRKDIRSNGYDSNKGKYDDIINANPNRRVYAGRTSLLETMGKDYFALQNKKVSVNRGIGSTFSMFDMTFSPA